MAQEASELDAVQVALSDLDEDALFRTAKVGLDVVRVDDGETVYSFKRDRVLVPASTMKVVTAAAALRGLGPSYTFRTTVARDAEVEDSVLKGNLYVHGGADPTLVIEKLWKLVYDIKLSGVDSIEGDVVLDQTMFGPDFRLPGWTKERDIRNGPSYFPRVGSLALNFGTIAIVVRPGSQAGEPAKVMFETPAGSYLTLRNELETTAEGSRRRVEIERLVTERGMEFVVSGTLPMSSKMRRYYRTVDNPTKYFGAAFAALADELGLEVQGIVRVGDTPEGAEVLIERRSPPLSSVLMDTNKYSNNFMAEVVLRTLGHELRADGTTDGGLGVVRSYLSGLSEDQPEFRVVNGSGLSRSARLAPEHLTTVLVDMAQDPTVGPEFIATLAIAGRDGTLSRRMQDVDGKLRGKTGTIDGVHCLAGYVLGGDGNLYAFAFMVNDFRGSVRPVKALHDEFARRLVQLGTNRSEKAQEEK